MLYALAIGYFQQAVYPFTRPVFALGMGLIFTAIFFMLIAVALTVFVSHTFAILCILMSIDGYFQSYAWPNLLMLINSQYDNKK
jgi:sugar phosphate permease